MEDGRSQVGDGELKDWGFRTKKPLPRLIYFCPVCHFCQKWPTGGDAFPYRRSTPGEEMGGEVVEFTGLEAERFGEETDLDLGGTFALLTEEAKYPVPVERGNVADDGGVLWQLGDLAGIGIGIVEITGGVDQF